MKIFTDRIRFIRIGLRQGIIPAKRVEILEAIESEFQSISPMHRATDNLRNPFPKQQRANED